MGVASTDADRLARIRAEVINSRDLPTIPSVLARILTVLADDGSSPKELVEVIAQDQALTANLLRLANSAFLGVPGKVSTLMRAVMVLGFRTVRNLAVGVKIWETFGRDRPQLVSLWRHAALAGSCARLAARKLPSLHAEDSFVAGLLHDVGRAVLCLRFPESYLELTAGESGDPDELCERERETFGVDHAQAGAWLGEAWRLPHLIVESARHHHETLVPGMVIDVPLVVALANRLVHRLESSSGALLALAEDDVADLAAIALDVPTWLEISVLLQEQEGELEAFFGGGTA